MAVDWAVDASVSAAELGFFFYQIESCDLLDWFVRNRNPQADGFFFSRPSFIIAGCFCLLFIDLRPVVLMKVQLIAASQPQWKLVLAHFLGTSYSSWFWDASLHLLCFSVQVKHGKTM